MVRMPKLAGYAGRLFPINPIYDTVEEIKCYPSLAALPETAEHVVLGVANAKLEAALEDAVAHGARAVTIFASGVPEGDDHCRLIKRIKTPRAKSALRCAAVTVWGSTTLIKNCASWPSILPSTCGAARSP